MDDLGLTINAPLISSLLTLYVTTYNTYGAVTAAALLCINAKVQSQIQRIEFSV